jgi:hypothetical protein
MPDTRSCSSTQFTMQHTQHARRPAAHSCTTLSLTRLKLHRRLMAAESVNEEQILEQAFMFVDR